MGMKRATRKQLRTIRRRRLALALAGAMAMPAVQAQTLPWGHDVVSGDISAPTYTGNFMTITQTSKGGIIDWASFSIGAGYGVTFDQQFGSTSVTLNRVVGFGYGTGASIIEGSLRANGNVFLINPAGITFGNGAYVNVGGLVASTLWMNEGDFINGMNTGQYVFNGFNGDASSTHHVGNFARIEYDALTGLPISGIVTGAGGVAFVGPTLRNSGDIVSSGGNIGFGAGTAVTLDFVGDGLTQVTINAAPTVDSMIIQSQAGTMTADGQRILLRTAMTAGGTGGAINVSGVLRAQSIASANGRIELTSNGAVVVGALGTYSDAGSLFTPGRLDVSGQAGENGGAVLIRGGSVMLVNSGDNPFDPIDPGAAGSIVDASGGMSGGAVDIESLDGVLGLPLTTIVADGGTGSGGQIRVIANNDISFVGSTLSAGSKTADGGLIGVRSVAGDILLTRTSNFGSTTYVGGQGSGGDIGLFATAGQVALGGQVNASGGANGGDVRAIADEFVMGPNATINANGSSGSGGTIGVVGSTSLAAYGLLSARGGSVGGSISTFTGGTFDVQGLDVDAGGAAAGTWTIWAPNLTVVDGNDQGPVGNVAELGEELQDTDIQNALATGTNVTLRAGVLPGDGGDVYFNKGVSIDNTSGLALALRVDANGGIGGSDFSIGASSGSLLMAFNADASSQNSGFAGISFANATFDSNGADILMYGQSDLANGVASNYDSGVELANSVISTAGGDLLLRGASSGGDASGNDSGVLVEATTIDVGGGSVAIYGAGAGDTHGVGLDSSSIFSAGGDIDIEGHGAAYGLFVDGSEIASGGGQISLRGYGGSIGVSGDYGELDSAGGNIVVYGEGATGNGVDLSAMLVSGGGDIAIEGVSTDATGVVFGGGYYDAISSEGGDILVEGSGASGGVALYGNGYGNSAVDSAGGSITVIGGASSAGAVGVYLDDLGLLAGAGDVLVDGASPDGVGVLFSNGAGVATTTGAITLNGLGASFGLDIADGAIDTDSGDITLEGEATAADAVAGVRVTGQGLQTNGGDITVTGTSAGGVGVQLGDGGTFAIGSGGGAISIDGVGVDAGVLMQGNQVASGGGVVSINGTGGGLGVSLDGSEVDSGDGGVTVTGTASDTDGVGVSLDDAQLAGGAGNISVVGLATAGTGVSFGSGSSISTSTGDIALTGVGAEVGLVIDGSTLSTEGGHFDLRGRGTAATSSGLVIGEGVSIITDGGGIALSGEGGSGAGLSVGTGAVVDAGDSLIVIRAANDGGSDAVRLGGAIRSGVGVNLRPGGVDANGDTYERVDDEILIGGGGGFALSSGELALIDSPELIIGSNQHAGAIRVLATTSRDGNMTLQNDEGSGGIDLQASLDVGGGTLALSSGGSITQTAGGAVIAHSLLARAGGDVLLAEASNDVADTTLAGSAGGHFEFQDVTTLALGSVGAFGMDAASDSLTSMAATGVGAGGDAFVRNLDGDMTLNAGVTAASIDLVTAGRLQNPVGATLIASGDWRVWANTWEGESRGGLAGSGDLPNLYGCAYLGACGVTVPGTDDHFIYVQQPTALITFDSFSREYGLPNPTLTFTVSGAILGDSAVNVATGTGTTTATIGSDVGLYPILGSFTSAAGYNIQFAQATLSVTPATLLFTADPFVRYLGFPNPDFTGTVSGFRNGDTLESVFGSDGVWSTPADMFSPVGYYPINGGTSARNYVFVQAGSNETALQVIPMPQLTSTPIDLIRDPVDTYVYDSNIGTMPVCAVNTSIDDQQLASSGDALSTEWSKVRSRPNLTNCFDSERRNGCGDF